MNGLTTADLVHALAILVACVALLGALVGTYLWPVVCDVLRRRAIRHEVEAARTSHSHRDAGRPRVSPLPSRVRDAADGGRGDVAAVLPLSLSDTGVVVGHGAPHAHLSQGLAFRRELARRGQGVAELEIEDLIR